MFLHQTWHTVWVTDQSTNWRWLLFTLVHFSTGLIWFSTSVTVTSQKTLSFIHRHMRALNISVKKRFCFFFYPWLDKIKYSGHTRYIFVCAINNECRTPHRLVSSYWAMRGQMKFPSLRVWHHLLDSRGVAAFPPHTTTKTHIYLLNVFAECQSDTQLLSLSSSPTSAPCHPASRHPGHLHRPHYPLLRHVSPPLHS